MLFKFGIKRAHIECANIKGCPFIEVYIPRKLSHEEIIEIECMKAFAEVVVYWKLPWWKNRIGHTFTLIEHGVLQAEETTK